MTAAAGAPPSPRVAMMLTGSWAAAHLYTALGFDYDVAPIKSRTTELLES
jgi:hypothetical protein